MSERAVTARHLRRGDVIGTREVESTRQLSLDADIWVITYKDGSTSQAYGAFVVTIERPEGAAVTDNIKGLTTAMEAIESMAPFIELVSGMRRQFIREGFGADAADAIVLEIVRMNVAQAVAKEVSS